MRLATRRRPAHARFLHIRRQIEPRDRKLRAGFLAQLALSLWSA